MARGFKGIWIPACIWEDKNLTAIDKILLAEIDSLDMSDGHCFASNEYFSRFLGISVSSVTRSLKKLSERYLIKIDIERSKKGTERRIMSLVKMTRGGSQIDEGGGSQIDEHINTVNYNTNYNPPKSPKGGRFKPDLSFITDGEEWTALYLDWCKGKKSPYTKQAGVKAGFSKLKKLSDGNIETAREIVDNSLANNWSGLFEIKPGSKKDFDRFAAGENGGYKIGF